MPRAYGGRFNTLEFRDSGLVVEVAAKVDGRPGYQTTLATAPSVRPDSSSNGWGHCAAGPVDETV